MPIATLLALLALLAMLAAAAFAAMALAEEPPREFTAARDGDTVKLAWTEPETGKEILAYLLKRNPSWNNGAAVGIAAEAREYRDQNADQSASYTYTLQAYYKGEGPGDEVTAASIGTQPEPEATPTTEPEATPTTAPTPTSTPAPGELAATGLTSSEQQNGISLAWARPTRDEDEITGYQVLRRIPSDGEDTLAVHDTTSGQDTSYLDTAALTQGNHYVYRVKALRPNGISRWSNYTNLTRETQGTTPDPPAPTPTPVPSTPAPEPEPEQTFSPPAHMASVWWKYDECGCHRYRPSQTIDFTIHEAPDPPEGNGIYLMAAYGQIGGASYYAGLQTNVADTGNRGLIFSRWGDNNAAHGRAANGGRLVTGYENGPFVSARVDHAWTTGDHSIVISQDGADAHSMWYKAVLKTNGETGVTIGHLRFPFKGGFSHMTGSTYSTIEIYGEPTSPSLVPKWHVSLEPPEGATKAKTLYGGSQGEDAYRNTHTNSDAHYENGRVHLRAGGDTTRDHEPATHAITQ